MSRCATEEVDIECPPEMEGVLKQNQYCGLILDISGPFRECLSMVPATDAEMFYKFCTYDVCGNWQDPKEMVCNALETFVHYCYDNGAGPITYRTADFCPGKH